MAFDMPGNGIPGYLRKAVSLAQAGIFDLRIHHDEVVMPLLRHWHIFDVCGLDAAAEADRERLRTYLGELDASADRFVERRAASTRQG
jgi:acyl-[acyl-carrier-protein] desaturase